MARRQHAGMQIATHAETAAMLSALRASQAAATTTRIEAVWARHQDEVQAAQQLRWRVFAGEMGATLKPPPGTAPGLDADLFDAHCEHLIVRTVPGDDAPPQVVGTYRVLTPSAARRLGALYSDGEFDLVRLRALRPHLAELGRSCTDPQWRQGGVILTLWSSLGEFLQRNGLQGVIGCASVSMRDGGRQAAALWHQLRQTRLAAPDLQVRPRRPLPMAPWSADIAVETPPLIKGYLRCGAQVLGPPAWDPDFGTADLPMLLRLADLPAAYRKRFITS
jgi:putative hemolysin